jgi:hypothetical protein
LIYLNETAGRDRHITDALSDFVERSRGAASEGSGAEGTRGHGSPEEGTRGHGSPEEGTGDTAEPEHEGTVEPEGHAGGTTPEQ